MNVKKEGSEEEIALKGIEAVEDFFHKIHMPITMTELGIKPTEEELEKMILFETGTYSFAGKPMFNFSLVRQYLNEEEEYYQLHLDIMFEPTPDNSSFQQACNK